VSATCSACATVLVNGARFCHRCGDAVPTENAAEPTPPTEPATIISGNPPDSSPTTMPHWRQNDAITARTDVQQSTVAAPSRCSACGRTVSPTATFCRFCGERLHDQPDGRQRLQAGPFACLRCGAPAEPQARFCRHCGLPASASSPAVSEVATTYGAQAICGICGAPTGGDERTCRECAAMLEA